MLGGLEETVFEEQTPSGTQGGVGAEMLATPAPAPAAGGLAVLLAGEAPAPRSPPAAEDAGCASQGAQKAAILAEEVPAPRSPPAVAPGGGGAAPVAGAAILAEEAPEYCRACSWCCAAPLRCCYCCWSWCWYFCEYCRLSPSFCSAARVFCCWWWGRCCEHFRTQSSLGAAGCLFLEGCFLESSEHHLVTVVIDHDFTSTTCVCVCVLCLRCV